MTKEQLIELVGKALPTKQHPAMIGAAIGRAFNQILYSTFRKDLSNLDLYTRPYDTTIEYDSSRDVYYSNIPAPIVQLPVPGDGIRMITPVKEKGVHFVPMKDHAMRMFDVFTEVSSFVGWAIRNQRVEYESGLQGMQITKHLVIPFDMYEDEDEIYLPVGADMEIIGLAAQILTGMRPEKKTIDSTEKTN